MYYKISGQKIWSVAEAKFVAALPENSEVQELYDGNSLMDEAGLCGWLAARGEPLGVLAPVDDARANALEALRMRKWAAKGAGITVNGIAIDTDDKGQATINGAVTNVLLDPQFKAVWKTSAVDETGGSVWVELDGQMLVALSKAMTSYTEACFAVEAAKQVEIAACATTGEVHAWMADKLETDWPVREFTL